MRRRVTKIAPLPAVEPSAPPPNLDAVSSWLDPKSASLRPSLAKGHHTTGQLVKEHFRCPGNVADFEVEGNLSEEPGYFRFGPDVICYGRCSSGVPAKSPAGPLHDVKNHPGTPVKQKAAGSPPSASLPFDAAEVIDTLRCERYVADASSAGRPRPANMALQSAYYLVRPLMGVAVRKHFQRLYFRLRNKTPFPHWPVDRTVENIFEQLLSRWMKAQHITRLPFVWFWPEGAPSCAILSHDIESPAGIEFCPKLMALNDAFGIKSSFQVVPEDRYPIPETFLASIREHGFEVNVHDLNHDGHLFREREEFLRRAKRINSYGRQFGALGFRSAVMYRNVDWFDALDFSYDMSIPNVAHLDPQKGGCCTVMPFFVGNIVELPVTTTQDYSLFNILRDYSIRLWKEQIALIQEKHGLISVIVHPDYIIDGEARRVYVQLLEYLTELRSRGLTWIALPGEVAAWWRLRSKLNVVQEGDSWKIEGPGSERARLAYATLAGDSVTLELA